MQWLCPIPCFWLSLQLPASDDLAAVSQALARWKTKMLKKISKIVNDQQDPICVQTRPCGHRMGLHHGYSNRGWAQKLRTRTVPRLALAKKWRETRPSILCVTHQMNHKERNYSAVLYEMMNYKWYQQVLGQCKAILAGTWWYWVSTNWYCLVLCGTGSV